MGIKGDQERRAVRRALGDLRRHAASPPHVQPLQDAQGINRRTGSLDDLQQLAVVQFAERVDAGANGNDSLAALSILHAVEREGQGVV